MSNFVDQIYDAFMSTIETVLDTNVVVVADKFKPLDYVVEVEKNHFEGNKQKYGVLPLGYERQSGPLGSLTVDQVFQVVLVDSYINVAKNDSAEREKARNVFAKMDDISKEIYNTKIGLPNLVQFVDHVSADDPEYNEEDKIVILRGNFLVKYRRSIK
jgi:hypothetical protein